MADCLFLENLDEFINDENKVVTYKWLSRTLHVHVNLAKQMLYTFVEEQRNKKDNDKINVTYAVTGFRVNEDGNKTYNVCVTNEEDLDVTKSTLEHVTSCHVYSVQKAKLKDSNSLYTADYDLMRQHIRQSNEYSSINCPSAIRRSENDMSKLKQQRKDVPKAEQKKPAPSSVSTNGATKSSTKDNKGKKDIAGMFAKASQKKEDTRKETTKTTEITNRKDTKKKGGVMAMFANQANKPKTAAAKPVEKSVPSDKTTEKSDVKGRNTSKKTKAAVEAVGAQEAKRRRIQTIESDSSSEEEMEEEDEAPIPPSPPPRAPTPEQRAPTPEQRAPTPEPDVRKEPSKISKPSEAPSCGRTMKKKLVTKTFVNDEGFIVTEKTYETVYSDGSDTEAKEQTQAASKVKATKKEVTKKEEKKKRSPPPKKSTAVKPKQTNMMSFFKKQ